MQTNKEMAGQEMMCPRMHIQRAVVTEDGIQFEIQTPWDKTPRSVDLPVTVEQYSRWCNGELIQNAWPEGTAEQRETLISGISDWPENYSTSS